MNEQHLRQLAQQVLEQALDDVRRESLQTGRSELFETLYPALLDPETSLAGSTYPTAELRVALKRLRQRLRERVDARLRETEPDRERRRALRRRLLVTTHTDPGPSL